MTIENWPDLKRLSYDARYICHHPGKTYNLIQCVEEFPTGGKRSRQMLKIFRHILLHLRPKITSFIASMKKNRSVDFRLVTLGRDEYALHYQFGWHGILKLVILNVATDT